MNKLKIIRPNGEEEIAELTTDKSLVGNNYLKLDIGGVPHYAKVGDVVDTHVYTFTGVDGKKYYVKKEIGNVENPPSVDSPTLNIYGDLVLTEEETPPSHFEFAVSSKEARINTKSDGYRVTRFFAAGAGDVILVEFTVKGISEFYLNKGIYTTSPINIKIGNVSLVANRGEGENIEAVGTKEDFTKLKENVGKPLNFSIKYP